MGARTVMRDLAAAIIGTAVSAAAFCGSAAAASITLEWATVYNGKMLTIESGPTPLYTGKLDGGRLQLDSDGMLDGSGVSRQAIVSVEDHGELAVAINLFACSGVCDWRITFGAFDEANSVTAKQVCSNAASNLPGQFVRYFFCRAAYRQFTAVENASCWTQSLWALNGWFDAAYRLHQTTLKDGIGFIARDAEVEDLVREALRNCPDFETRTRRKPGYFRSMMTNLDIAILQQAQKVERLLKEEEEAQAVARATSLVRELDTVEPLRAKIPPSDAVYVEGVINRSLRLKPQFVLR